MRKYPKIPTLSTFSLSLQPVLPPSPSFLPLFDVSPTTLPPRFPFLLICLHLHYPIKFQDKDVWKIQSAETQREFDEALDDLEAKSRSAAVYLRNLDPPTWALYPDAKKLSLFGHRTSNHVESQNSKFLGVRAEDPLLAMDRITTEVMTDLAQRLDKALTRYDGGDGSLLTKHAEKKLEEQRVLAARYSVLKVSRMACVACCVACACVGGWPPLRRECV